MTEAFISYSRKNTEFARRLFNALEATGRDAWVDWEGIPYSADWWREICRGVDSSEVFLFIASPDSFGSMVCNQELEYARQSHKRIIPIILHDSNEAMLKGLWQGKDFEAVAQANWAEFKKLNWLFFREQDDFETAFSHLVQAIEQDPEHLHYHTRLLIRAREWEENEQDKGFLLRGDDLRQAESWLQFNAAKDPRPTTLHQDYIAASLAQRAREERRTRYVITTLAVLLILALAAALFAFDRQQAATDQANIASTNEANALSAEATSARQADDALSILWARGAQDSVDEGDYDSALPLILAANRFDNPPALAREALYEIAYTPGLI